MEATTATTEPGHQQHRKRAWPLIVSIIALIVIVFEVSYNFGQVYVDRTQHIPFTDGFCFTMAVWWVIATYRKNASPRVRKWALAVVLQLVALTAVASFGAGRRTRYPEEARKLVEILQLHAREVKKIKAEISDARSTSNDPEDLLIIQPKVSAWKEHIEEVEALTRRITTYNVPAYVSQMMTLLGQALPTEKRQIANIEKQITLVRSAQGLRANDKSLIYRQQLLPLVQQEEQIERERLEANLEEKIKNVPRELGYK
jgi:hypothetical protein